MLYTTFWILNESFIKSYLHLPPTKVREVKVINLRTLHMLLFLYTLLKLSETWTSSLQNKIYNNFSNFYDTFFCIAVCYV
jgi:hypothetical protein